MTEYPPQSGLDIDDVPVEGPDAPEIENTVEDYAPPGRDRDYPRADDATDEAGDRE